MTTYKKLGGVNPVAGVNTSLFQVPVGSSYIISTLNICNFGSDPATLRVAHITNGAVEDLSDDDWVLYGVLLAPNGILPLTIGMALYQGDSLIVYSDTSDVAFIAWGAEE